MEVHVSLSGPGDLAARIYRGLLEALVDGNLRSGERLPPTRELARRLGVSRNTVTVAYDRLTAEGFLVSRVGAGTFVAARARAAARSRSAPPSAVRPLPVWADIPVMAASPKPRYDFRVGTPDPRLFPLETWRRLVTRELRRAESADYAEPAGHPGLRAAIARHVSVSRSVRAGADDVLITHGAQQALDLIARVLVEPGDMIAVEEPGYPPARRLFHSLGAHLIGVPVDDDGLDVAALPRDARLVYVTPSHQFPLGTPMSLARRGALLAWAQRHDAAIIEDDYDSEYRFSGRPLEPLQSLDRSGRVIYVGSFSKTLLPVLRLGFLVAPASIAAALRTARQLADWHGDPATQGALAAFIDEGLLARHIRKTSRSYADRHARILAALKDFSPWLRPIQSAAGLHLCARFTGAPAELDRILARAQDAGVGVDSLATYCATEPAQPGLVIGYGSIHSHELDEGLRLLRGCFPGG